MSRLYPLYRDSGVEWLGKVPDHWEMKRLARSVQRSDDKVDFQDVDDMPYVGLEHVRSWTGSLLPLDELQILEGMANSFTFGDVLFGKLRPYLAKAFCADFDGLCSTEFLVLKSIGYDRRYLLDVLLTDGFVSLINSSTYGAKMPRTNWDFVGSTILPVPPLDEQRAIAAFLDRETQRIDALVEKKRRLIERLQEYRTALITRTVTRGLPPEAARASGLDPSPRLKPSGVEWLGDVPEHWDVLQPSMGFEKIGSGTTPRSDSDEYYDGKTPWVTTSELREETIFRTAKTVSATALREHPTLRLYPVGALVIAMYGATIGRLGILGVPATVNQACCVFAGETRLRTKFVHHWLMAFREVLIAYSAGGGQPNLSQEDLRNLRIPTPALQEQDRIIEYLDAEDTRLRGLATETECAVERLQEYRSALITSAVTGKIDVREAAREPVAATV